MNQDNIGKFIASLRKEHMLTQERLAERLGVNSRSVSRWENGACMPDYALLPLLAKELNVCVADLLEGKRVTKSSYFIREEAYLKNYQILLTALQKEKAGEEFSSEEKQEITTELLDGIACKEDVKKYKLRMRVNPFTDTTYPNYYIPPYNENKKLRLADGHLPKTHILYANYYELEILRMLYQFAPDNGTIQEMVEHTLKRLKSTCYGNKCPQGECVATGKIVLRFLQTVCPEEKEWIKKLQ